MPPASTDGTSPTVTAVTPADGATNVWVETPIEVTFSEALDPATVTDAAVQLAGTGSVNLAKNLALGDGNTRLTVGALDGATGDQVRSFAKVSLFDLLQVPSTVRRPRGAAP